MDKLCFAAPNYQLALFGAGDRPRHALTARLRLAALLRAWGEISAASLLLKAAPVPGGAGAGQKRAHHQPHGLPVIAGGTSFYGLALPAVKSSFSQDVRKAWQGEGPLTIVTSPSLDAIYAVRISPVEWAPLAQRLGLAVAPLAGDGWRPRRFNTFKELAGAVERRRQMKPGRMGSIWKTKGEGHENGA